MSGAGDREDLFWRLVQPRLDRGEVERGTLMGRPCIRVGGDFAAMPHSKTGALIVKLTEARVAALVEEGVGEPFAPAGRVFRAWLAVSEADEARWAALLDEAVAGG